MWQLLELDLASVFNLFEAEEIHFSLSRGLTLRMCSAAPWQDGSCSCCAVGSTSQGTALLEHCSPTRTPKGALDLAVLLGQRLQLYVFSCRAAFLQDAQGFLDFLAGGPGDWWRQQHGSSRGRGWCLASCWCDSGSGGAGVAVGGISFGWVGLVWLFFLFLCWFQRGGQGSRVRPEGHRITNPSVST